MKVIHKIQIYLLFSLSYCFHSIVQSFIVSTHYSCTTNHHPTLTFLQNTLDSNNNNHNTNKSNTMEGESMRTSRDSTKYEELVRVGTIAAKAAGDIILNYKGGADVTKVKFNNKDLLTEVDPMCEKIIRDTIAQYFPKHSILGEEDVEPGKDASTKALDMFLQRTCEGDHDDNEETGYLWIVDPIDGTSNFVHGMPLCMPSIACAYRGEVVAGVIYDPHRDELFTATLHGGAFMNGEKIEVGQQNDIGEAIVAMGSPPAAESLEMSLKGIALLMPKVRTIRMLGSAAIMLAWVANGRLTSYWEYDLSSWDIAAGALLVKEAGGKFTDLNGNDFKLRNRKIVASNGKVHQAILDTLRDAGVH